MSHRNVMFTVYSQTPKSALQLEGSTVYVPYLLQKDNADFEWSVPLFEASSENLSYDPRVRYFIYQREVCPETGRHHYQGYIEFFKNLTVKQIQTVLGSPKCHLEKRLGTQQQAIEYCSKSETRIEPTVEWGTKSSGQGSRTDLANAKKDILNSAIAGVKKDPSIRKFASEHPALYVKMHVGFEKLINLNKADRDEPPLVLIFWGPTGTGKSWVANSCKGSSKTRSEDFSGFLPQVETRKDIYVKPDGQWYQGYDSQQRCLFEEYDCNPLPISEFLKITDRYQHQVPFKGGFAAFNSPVIVFTSNCDPRRWYWGESVDKRKAFQRRVSQVYYFPQKVKDIPCPVRDITFHDDFDGGSFVPSDLVPKVSPDSDDDHAAEECGRAYYSVY